VQNLFALRFGNALFEPLWRRETIANIQITIAEDLGVEKRGAFYDSTGALRDMVQNHALQLLCALAMEPPINAHADAIRDEKLKVLRSLKPWTPQALGQDVIRGQYMSGKMGGEIVAGYDEPGVNRKHQETLSRCAEIANWRWPACRSTSARASGWLARRAHRRELPPGPTAIFHSPVGPAHHPPAAQGRAELHLLAQAGPAPVEAAAQSLAFHLTWFRNFNQSERVRAAAWT
jgi:glucose-6-phosphate 1-dehydrogenase